MKVRIPKQHLMFTIAYFITILTLLLYQIDALPAPMILRRTKYVYIIFVAILALFNGRIKKHTGWAVITIGLFIVHTFIFGYIFTNPIAATTIETNVSQMMWFLLMVLVTYIYVSQNNLFELFINTSFYVTGVQLIVAGLLHHSDFVNPIWGLVQSFTADVRYKTTFGYVHAGYLSNTCYMVLILAIFYYELNRKKTGKKKTFMWASLVIIGGLAVLMLTAAAERSGILSTCIVYGIYLVFVLCRIRVEHKTKMAFTIIIVVALLVMEATGVFTYIWDNSNRSLNITVNYPVFQQLGNLWTGMGYVDNSGFHEDVLAFGVRTSSLDMYYVYIFFTTGVLGCILIGLALIIMLIRLFVLKKTNLRIITIGVYLSMLFFAFWQCNMVTYRYVSPTILFLIVLFGMSDDFCMGEEKLQQQEINEKAEPQLSAQE